MASEQRVYRVAQSLQQILAQVIAREIKDPRLARVAITGVKVSRDLAHAVVYVEFALDKEPQDTIIQLLNKASGFFRKRIGQELELRIVPTLKFHYDPAQSAGEKIDNILRDL